MFSKFFIERPIFATVLALLFVVAGLVTLNILPVAQYPDITPPTVQVSAVYPGANAETVAQTVGIPIEQQVNGVDGMLYMSSNSSASGAYSLTVTFEVGTDIDMATVMVQNRVAFFSFFVIQTFSNLRKHPFPMHRIHSGRQMINALSLQLFVKPLRPFPRIHDTQCMPLLLQFFRHFLFCDSINILIGYPFKKSKLFLSPWA